MTRSRIDFRMRDPEIFLPLPPLACAHCYARILRTIAVDHEIFFVKESRLAPQAASHANHGERVVTGQRMLQSASDVFLGRTHDAKGHDYCFRQLRDMKMKIDLENTTKGDWLEYVEICGWTLGAHTRGQGTQH